MTTAGFRRSVLMGDPGYFSIQGGANPHTRDRWGRRKRVERAKAQLQWHALAKLLTDLGVDVYVVPADPKHPGLVYPANAGVVVPPESGQGTMGLSFVLANLVPSRAGEQPIYHDFLEKLGLSCFGVRHRFEGEADLFPVGDRYVFTHGRLAEQRFVPRWGFPPWKRVYGFRSDLRVLEELRTWFDRFDPLALELRHEAHYHGDTVMCSFGPNREHLLVWLEGLTLEGQVQLKDTFGDAILAIDDDDAALYAANSFGLTVRGEDGGEESVLVMPEGLSDDLYRAVEDRGVRPIPIGVSEFLAKGGGSVKCMIGDLGMVPPASSSAVSVFREEHLYARLCARLSAVSVG